LPRQLDLRKTIRSEPITLFYLKIDVSNHLCEQGRIQSILCSKDCHAFYCNND
jgi:hypothetical protein